LFFPEQAMPHRRTIKKGSFGAHFDELVKHFPHDRRQPKSDDSEESEKRDPKARSVHDQLFENAWREARDRTPRAPR
jgi:hypothetical protein